MKYVVNTTAVAGWLTLGLLLAACIDPRADALLVSLIERIM